MLQRTALSTDTIFFATVLESCAPVISTFNLFNRIENTEETLMILKVVHFFKKNCDLIKNGQHYNHLMCW